MKCVSFLWLSVYILGGNAGVVSFIDPCHWKDSGCILKSSRKAIPFVIPGIAALGIQSLNPLVLNDVNGDNGELKLKFKNMNVKRISECKIIKVERPEKLKAYLELDCPVTATGQYILGGKLFVLPVYGEGDFEIKTDKYKIIANIILKEFKKDGKLYYKFASYNYKYDPLEKVYFRFDNLFHGDKVKAEPILKILDESWKELVGEVGKPVIEEIMTQVFKTVGKFFNSVPADELELP